ncbi:hypothetical protein Droror1_Dr00024802 [Drosera rotundifolia]
MSHQPKRKCPSCNSTLKSHHFLSQISSITNPFASITNIPTPLSAQKSTVLSTLLILSSNQFCPKPTKFHPFVLSLDFPSTPSKGWMAQGWVSSCTINLWEVEAVQL